MNFFERLWLWIKSFFSKQEITTSPTETTPAIPQEQKPKNWIEALQIELNKYGEGLVVNGELDTKTKTAIEKYDIEVKATRKTVEKKTIPVVNNPQSVNPAYVQAKKHTGKTEYDSAFNKYLSGFWAMVGLPSYKTIIGTTFAWCGLFIAAMNSETGLKIVGGAAGAVSWAKYGQEIDFKKDGIPRGAVLRINNNGDCSSGWAGNHVTFADGDCTVEDLKATNATVPGFGGNQADSVKRSNYPVKNVCNARWPAEIQKPGPITKSFNCQKVEAKEESTR